MSPDPASQGIVLTLIAMSRYLIEAVKILWEGGPLKRAAVLLTCGLIITIASVTLYSLVWAAPNSEPDATLGASTRIALLFPIEETPSSAAYEDGERQALGLVHFLKKHPEATKRYHFIIINHGMDPQKARDAVIDELKLGTQYFLVTMSKIGEPLSAEFPQLVASFSPKHLQPRLIVTVASSPEIRTVPGSVYRFYIRSQDEGAVLAEAAHLALRSTTASSIAVDDEYGRGAVKSFETKWVERGHAMSTGTRLPPTANTDLIKQLIRDDFLARIPAEQRELVFLAHYGHALQAIVQALHEAGQPTCLAATSTMSIETWRRPVQSILTGWTSIIATPVSQTEASYDGDVVQDFVYFSLDRLLWVLQQQDQGPHSFDEAWRTAPQPERVKYTIDADGDATIELTATKNLIRGLCTP
jgi:hypothetical protein